ncbi:MAG: hypothetical protein JRI23_16220 [Deltaproteobacteria bacterium]|jgi:hypothetical protein|nr:hypothetical protein [Deltaproteobacteria bacterium]MBW2533317.1 hypothetical protein [Deltaproteobacteria bacterium]
MRFSHSLVAAAAVSALAFAACEGADVGSDEQFAVEGSVLSIAPVLAFEEVGSGSITGRQIDLWGFDAQAGDQLSVVKTVTDGDLAPDFLLFRGAAAGSIASSSYAVEDGKLTKHYTVGHDTRFFIAVRAYEGNGAGDYTLEVTCAGGPCAGGTPDPVEVELDLDQQAECLYLVRECAFAKLPGYDGYVGPTRARNIVNECLHEHTVDDDESDLQATCRPLCDGDNQGLCDSLIGQLPWFADQSQACLQEWNYCVDDCHQEAGYNSMWEESLEETAEAVCTLGSGGLGGGCATFIGKVKACGGSLDADDDYLTYCKERCEDVAGAWVDDTSDLCDYCYE